MLVESRLRSVIISTLPAVNDGGAGGEVLEGNLIFNFVRETGDHVSHNISCTAACLHLSIDRQTDDTACATLLCCFDSVAGYVQLLGQATAVVH